MSTNKKISVLQLILTIVYLSFAISAVVLLFAEMYTLESLKDLSDSWIRLQVILWLMVALTSLALFAGSIVQIVFASKAKSGMGIASGICALVPLFFFPLIAVIILNIIIISKDKNVAKEKKLVEEKK